MGIDLDHGESDQKLPKLPNITDYIRRKNLSSEVKMVTPSLSALLWKAVLSPGHHKNTVIKTLLPTLEEI